MVLCTDQQDAMYEGLHGKRIGVPGTEIYLSLEHVKKERSRITIHWLPATYTEEAVKVIVTALTGDNQPEIFKIRDKEGKWGALCLPTRPIPHYASVDVPGRRDQWHTIMVTMPGRLTECQHCTRTDHWSNRCPNRRQKVNLNQSSHTDLSEVGRGGGGKLLQERKRW